MLCALSKEACNMRNAKIFTGVKPVTDMTFQ